MTQPNSTHSERADFRLRVARAIWDAMVNDEPPDAEALDREGFLDAADAALAVAKAECDRCRDAALESVAGDERAWTVHVCENHGRLDCSLCGVHDVVEVVPRVERDRYRDSLRDLEMALQAIRGALGG